MGKLTVTAFSTLDNVAEDPAYRHTDDVLHALVHKLYAAPPVSPPQG